MKYFVIAIALVSLSCRKSETQYINDKNEKATVNDRRSDTIKTLPETTPPTGPDSTHLKPETQN
ncbi:hypothetical protein [Chryseobacterium wangxinyae]|uniref:hypothetical protein n=1 Tax=Chryseobacterium sp. CY353 TaxID=2997334 RepID=UPI0022703663|nr:hypothetical protein [Chryseobacterium sp. CY353]MCY0967886.1 hypothetical protein [Chryseobacterium sp. CY353]